MIIDCYKPGCKILNQDCLSRLPGIQEFGPPSAEVVLLQLKYSHVKAEDIKHKPDQDPVLSVARTKLLGQTDDLMNREKYKPYYVCRNKLTVM